MNYEPGTVAIATFRGEPSVRVTRYDDGWARADDPDDIIGDYWNLGSREVVTDIRPLVVLDLNLDASDAQLLTRIANRHADSGSREELLLDSIAEQIKQQANPPKPKEPKGLGAQVLDCDDEMWVRNKVGQWINLHSEDGIDPALSWDELCDRYGPVIEVSA